MILVPLVANKIVTDNLYGVDGLADVIFFNAVTTAVLSPLLKIFSPGYIIARVKRWWYSYPTRRLYLTQKELNKLYEEIQFEIGAEYVEAVSMFLYTCFYASLQPIIVIITAIGFYFIIFAQRLSLFKMRKRPTPGSSEINTAMYYFVYTGPLFYSLGSICLTNVYGNFRHGIIPNALSLILSLCIIFAPYE